MSKSIMLCRVSAEKQSKKSETLTNRVLKKLQTLCGKDGKFVKVKKQVEELKEELKGILAEVGIIIDEQKNLIAPNLEAYVTVNNKTRKGSLDMKLVEKFHPELYAILINDKRLYKEDTQFLSFDDFGVPTKEMIKEVKKVIK